MVGIMRPARRPAGWVAPGPKPKGAGGDPTLLPADDEDLGYLAGDWRILQKQRGHRWSLDDLVTAWVAARHARGATRLLDLGCGLGSVLLLLAWQFPQARVMGVEAQADRADLARRSIRYNGAEERCSVVTGDLREMQLDGAFDLITGTPPYFPRGSGTESDQAHARACRFEVRGGVEDYFVAVARWLTPGGRAVVCSAALEADRVRAGSRAAGLSVLEHVDVVGRAGKQPLVMIDALARDPVETVQRSELIVRDATGQWTPAFRAVREAFGMPVQPP